MLSAANDAQFFSQSDKPHCLMISNHGLHQWDIIPGLPDTGGQNVYVNQFSNALSEVGFRVTIANRGGYPHPLSAKLRVGTHYKDSSQRILYLEDGDPHFIRKEDMLSHIPALTADLAFKLKQEGLPVDLIITHYWDAAWLAREYLQKSDWVAPHIWIPHSLAAIKKRNVAEDTWNDLHINERYQLESELISHVDFIGTTSPLISHSLLDDYHYSRATIDMPPCIETERFRPFVVQNHHPLWNFLSGYSSLSADEIRERRMICEISRSDRTKRKDILIKAFAIVHQQHEDALLLLTAAGNEILSMQLRSLINDLDLEDSVILLGSVSEWLPAIYNASYVYCTPSVMEGFGMSAQEAAACGKPIIASSLVPFVHHYLTGSTSQRLCDGSVLLGEGGMTFHPDDVDALACALNYLFEDTQQAHSMGLQALRKTIPYFTWEKRIQDFLSKINKGSPQSR